MYVLYAYTYRVMPDTEPLGYILVFRDTGEDAILTCIRISLTSFARSNERKISARFSPIKRRRSLGFRV